MLRTQVYNMHYQGLCISIIDFPGRKHLNWVVCKKIKGLFTEMWASLRKAARMVQDPGRIVGRYRPPAGSYIATGSWKIETSLGRPVEAPVHWEGWRRLRSSPGGHFGEGTGSYWPGNIFASVAPSTESWNVEESTAISAILTHLLWTSH